MEGLPEIFNRYNPYIEKQLRSLFDKRDLPLYDMTKYHLGWVDKSGRPAKSNTGKMLRATLCLLACESTGSDFTQALPAAAAIELIHNYSLVHDDIQDGDEIRRHRETVWKIWGKPQAINAGSALRMLANLAIIDQEDKKVSDSKKLIILDILDKSCLEMIEGQYLDIDFEERSDISVDEYIHMISKKTSALIAGSLKAGAAINIDKEKLSKFDEFGNYLGMAFQITDDILGIWGNDKKTGKPLASDIAKKKKSLPIVYSFRKLKRKEKEIFSNIYQKKEIVDQDLKKVLEYLNITKAKEYCIDLSRSYYEKALKKTEELPLKKSSIRDYKEITDFLINRDF